MTPLVAGVDGIGGPEAAALALMVMAIVFAVGLFWGRSKKRNLFSRYCPKCGRGLNQPPDARCCSYCGTQLPWARARREFL